MQTASRHFNEINLANEALVSPRTIKFVGLLCKHEKHEKCWKNFSTPGNQGKPVTWKSIDTI